MKTVTLYTDGACSGNPGPGGWGAILEYNGHEKELSGGESSTTNNRMELTAVIRGLQALKEPCIVELYSDSKYVIDALEKGWAWGWKKKNWIKSDKKPALNPDLWEVLLQLTQQLTVLHRIAQLDKHLVNIFSACYGHFYVVRTLKAVCYYNRAVHGYGTKAVLPCTLHVLNGVLAAAGIERVAVGQVGLAAQLLDDVRHRTRIVRAQEAEVAQLAEVHLDRHKLAFHIDLADARLADELLELIGQAVPVGDRAEICKVNLCLFHDPFLPFFTFFTFF